MLISQLDPLSFSLKTSADITSTQFNLKFYIPFNTLTFFQFQLSATKLFLYPRINTK